MIKEIQLPQFEGEDFNMYPADREFAIDLAVKLSKEYKYDDCELDKRHELEKHIVHAWVVCSKKYEVAFGIIYLSYHEAANMWTLDAYRDNRLLKRIHPDADFSYETGKLVINWFRTYYDEELFVLHDKRNRAATFMCQRIGFKFIKNFDTAYGVFSLLKLK